MFVTAYKSVNEVLNISSEVQFSTDLTLVCTCTHLQYLFSPFILPK